MIPATSCQQSLDLFEMGATPARHVPIQVNPRKRRALIALMRGPLSREDFDRQVGCSNGPDLILALRRLGFGITCTLQTRRDRDGREIRVGIYSLPDIDKAIVARCMFGREQIRAGAPE